MSGHAGRFSGSFRATDRFLRFQSRLGGITLAASDIGLRGLWFEGQHYFPQVPEESLVADDPLLDEARRQLQGYFSGQRQGFELPLDLSQGTGFQQRIWQVLLQIPFGTTTSYAELAARIGRRDAVRAVGAAIGRNPISVIVPCHRVLGSDGSLTGYAGGLERKIELLRIEGWHDLLG